MAKRTVIKMNFLEVIKKTKPQIVIMPIIMMLFGAMACIPYFLESNYETIRIIIYCLISLLFWFIPTTTIFFVLKKFRDERRNNLLKRMFITAIPALFLLVAFFTTWRYETLLVYGVLGFLYFMFDYITQGKLFLLIKRQPRLLKKENFINGVMSTKCSRSVLWEITRYMKDNKEKREVRKLMKDTGIRWWHLFPLTPESLTERIFPFFKKIL